ncbi:MAG: hypothetical protein M3416_01760 [Acidobacteriota bacterium]|nr:hypothetical protein [Acidobacteriota bacterium]
MKSPQKRNQLFFTLLLGLSLLIASVAYRQTASPPDRRVFRVALFPYIPDAAGDSYAKLLSRIEKEFEAENPSVDLVLKPMADDGFYEVEKLTEWLSNDPSGGGYHLVEVDTLLLGDLVSSNLAAEWAAPPGLSDWHRAGAEGVNVGGKVYGVPHWLCGHFIFTRDKKIAKAKTVSQLLDALRSADPSITNVTGVLTGSWNMPALYLDAWADTYGPKNVGSAISPNLDGTVMKSFKSFSQQCETGGKNPCLDGTFADNDLSAKQFADGKADAFFGYSERLNFILRQGAGGPRVEVASAPLGEGKRPLLFVDAFVMRRGCDVSCQEAAAKFAAYMNRPQTHEWILMSHDAGANAVPRYLLPATRSAYKAPQVRRDRYFKTLGEEIKDGAAYPVSGIPGMRKKMRDEILKQLQQ